MFICSSCFRHSSAQVRARILQGSHIIPSKVSGNRRTCNQCKLPIPQEMEWSPEAIASAIARIQQEPHIDTR